MADPGPARPRREPPAGPTIGVLIDNVDHDFQRAIWAGLEAAAREAGASVMNFLGGDLDPLSAPPRKRNAIFGLASPESLDGLVVVSSVLATHIGNDRLEEYCRRFRPLPMVSLGFRLPSMPSIVSDGQLGLGELLEHLLVQHGRKRFMWIGGTRYNADAMERGKVFRETLARSGVAIDPRLIRRADFDPEKAYGIVREVLAQGIAFDAVVSANDQMAISVLEALRDAKVRVPEDVSVTGFDDIPSAKRLSLPLTTVRQPMLEMSRRAMKLVLGMVRGEPPVIEERHRTQVIVRRSCGCLSPAVRRAGEPCRDPAPGAAPGGRGLAQAVLAELGSRDPAAPAACEPACVEELVRSFASDVEREGSPGTFLRRLDGALLTSFTDGSEDGPWDELLTVLRGTLGRLAPDPEARARAETLLHQARVMLKEASRQQQWRLHATLARNTLTVQFVVDVLIGSFDVPTLLDNMARELPRIGIRRCFLVVHASPGRPYQDARLLLAYDEGGRVPIGKDGLVYPVRRLLPEGILGRVGRLNLLWQPLIFGEEEIGFIGLELNPLDEISSLALAEQIRSALKASTMMQEISEKDRLLSNLDRVKNEFIANVTHDFRSLVAIILNSSWMGMDAHETGDIREVRELCGMAYEAALKLKVAIDRLLDLAQMDERGLVLKIRRARARSFLTELAAFYRPVLSVSGIALREEYSAEEIDDLFTDVDKVEEIMHNLISNAAKFVEQGKGTIGLSLVDRGDRVEIAVSDDGAGIEPDRLPSLFARFQRPDESRRWSASSGLGLAFVKELATYLGGSIAAQSEGPGKGARFVLTLPKGKAHLAGAVAGDEAGDSVHATMVRNEFRQMVESSLREKASRAGKHPVG